MKFSTATFTLLTVAAQAAAIDSSTNYPHAVFDNGVGFSGTQGQAGYIAKRAAEAVAEAIATRTRRVALSPSAAPRGMQCNQKRAAVDKIYNAAHKAFNAIEAREAAADANAIAEAHKKGGFVTFCGTQGMACIEKKSEHEIGRRMAGPEAHKKGGVVTFCGTQGMACIERRSPEPVAAPHKKGGVVTFCGTQGMACIERRELLNQVKRAIPNVERDECFSEDGPCTQIADAAQALEEVKRSLATAEDEENMSLVAKAHIKARSEGKNEAMLAEREADGPEGANTLARRALQELEDAINEGVAAINDPTL
ncbi:hypothetical protein Tdes44962_MAKER01432 [Teratosphaeria destructans]|uniref:Uncharacterized protein n=1 Tax=Teratosphaeria destructans TaxID=418781 RepID=A0A9W7W5V4_9PEZI|nr:hypothetical protein Tdes44962_MAKER01432 [Teratosphaeria destructans]